MRSPEKIFRRRPKKSELFGEDDPRFVNTHYSNKKGHVDRSDHHPNIKNKKRHR